MEYSARTTIRGQLPRAATRSATPNSHREKNILHIDDKRKENASQLALQLLIDTSPNVLTQRKLLDRMFGTRMRQRNLTRNDAPRGMAMPDSVGTQFHGRSNVVEAGNHKPQPGRQVARLSQRQAKGTQESWIPGEWANAPLSPNDHSVVQRYAYVGKQQIIEHDGEIKGLITYSPDDLEEKQKDYIDDRYLRVYKDTQEFEDHAKGQPVDFGVIYHLAKQYRLPFSGDFFILGENHGVCNYRTLVKESNQGGKILGEGGTVPIDHYAKKANARPEVETKKIGGASEIAMESILSKTSYALIYLKKTLTKTGSTKKIAKTIIQDPEKWLEKADDVNTKVRRDKRYKPYYVTPKKTKVYPGTEKKVKESAYSTYNTAIGVMKQCMEAIETYVAVTKYPDKNLVLLKQTLTTVQGTLAKGDQMTVQKKTDLVLRHVPTAITQCYVASLNEISRSTITHEGKQGHDLFKDSIAREHDQSLLSQACAMRDIYMLEAIIDASKAGFTMAGIGNNHLLHLRAALKKANIDTISFNEFMDKFTRDAFGNP